MPSGAVLRISDVVLDENSIGLRPRREMERKIAMASAA